MPVTRRVSGACLLSLLLLLSSCGEEGTPAPNIDPETTISGSIPPEAGRADHHVTFFWSGSDLDGIVKAYDYILEVYPRSIGQFSEIQLVEPDIGDSRWTRTSCAATNISLVLLADTLRADPSGDIGDGTFDRWHTFWVRATDNEGAVDQSPDKVTFQAFTKAPQMALVEPVIIGQVPVLPKTFVMNWGGGDDIGSGEFQDPLESRWFLKTVQLDGAGLPIGYPEAFFNLHESDWSDWVPWGNAGTPSRQAAFFDQLPPGGVSEVAFVFALQGRDDGGAITPQFNLDTANENNYGVFRVSDSVPFGPSLRVDSENLSGVGPWDFEGSASTPVLEIVSVGEVRINWGVMKAEHYGAGPGEYRFAWNIQDPENDDLWSVWSTVRAAPPQLLLLSIEELQIQARDNIGQVTTAILRFQKSP
jgi:hypothetical protein